MLLTWVLVHPVLLVWNQYSVSWPGDYAQPLPHIISTHLRLLRTNVLAFLMLGSFDPSLHSPLLTRFPRAHDSLTHPATIVLWDSKTVLAARGVEPRSFLYSMKAFLVLNDEQDGNWGYKCFSGRISIFIACAERDLSWVSIPLLRVQHFLVVQRILTPALVSTICFQAMLSIWYNGLPLGLNSSPIGLGLCFCRDVFCLHRLGVASSACTSSGHIALVSLLYELRVDSLLLGPMPSQMRFTIYPNGLRLVSFTHRGDVTSDLAFTVGRIPNLSVVNGRRNLRDRLIFLMLWPNEDVNGNG
ncbi:hypothetical protein VNO77_08774 [Canavalia gladiata]|uniref:Uncharacterized protein n=1 Tax=Canavalia gladiata TaxID=3824 RepID=A0AAN9M9E9_CANGL